MFTSYNGTLVEGSASLVTSVANAEIIPTGNTYVNFTFQADQICHIFVNGSANAIYLRASQIVSLDKVSSLKIQEGAITFSWIGTRF